MKKNIFILFLLSTQFTFGQIKNGSFEMWNSVYANPYTTALDTTYGVPNAIGGIVNRWSYYHPNDSTAWTGWGVSRTTDSHSGNYSLILHNWYNYATQSISYRDTLNYRPLYLQGYFKYIKGGTHPLAQGQADITLTRFNGASNDTIATGTYLFDTTSSFTPFQLTLNYISALTPDSINIYIINSNNTNNYSPTVVVTNLLYLDDLALSSSPLGIDNLYAKNVITISPNPATNLLTITTTSTQPSRIILYDIASRKLMEEKFSGSTTLNIANLAKGVYLYNVTDENGTITRGRVVKE